MKKMKRLTAIVVSFMLGLPYLLIAQDSGTYIEDLNTQDSSYMNQSMAPASDSSSSGNTAIIIVIAVVVVAAIIFFLMKKKKK